MQKFLTIIVYTIIVLMIGRNLPSLPRFSVLSDATSQASDLQKETQDILKDVTGNYGIYFADFSSDQHFGIDEKEMFTAASVNKVPIVAVFYYLENKGEIEFDQQITLQTRDIQDYGTGSLRYQKPGTTYSLKTLAKLALKQSDNTAAHILADKIGKAKIQETIEQFGLTQTDMEENQTTAYDMYLLFRKIYNNELTTKTKSQELLGFMNDTDIEDRLSLYLPRDATIYHKTGDTVGGLHDVGIIMYEDKIFFLGVLTSDIGGDENTAKQLIARIAKNTIEYYQKRK